MFQTIENKHPAFYQVFRIFVILFASHPICMESALFCKKRQSAARWFFRCISFITTNRDPLFSYQHSVYFF